MAFSDSMFFLFEIKVENCKLFDNFDAYFLRCNCSNLFKINLKCLNGAVKKPEQKNIVQYSKSEGIPQNQRGSRKIKAGRSVLSAEDVNSLISAMEKNPIEILIYERDNRKTTVGSVLIPWDAVVFDYVQKVSIKQDLSPVEIRNNHEVIDSLSNSIGTLLISIKLKYLKDKNEALILSPNLAQVKDCYNRKLKAIYGKRHGTSRLCPKGCKFNKNNEDECLNNAVSRFRFTRSSKNTDCKSKTNSKKFVRQQEMSPIIQPNILNYIFTNNEQSYGNQEYHVNYFTVEHDKSKDSSKISSKKSSKSSHSKDNISLMRCDSHCSKHTHSNTGLSIPKEYEQFVNVTKCNEIECENKNYEKTLEESDDQIKLDMSSSKHVCCDNGNEKIEQVVGGITATMKFGEDPCFCSCECTFGFTKKTTLCSTCGGFETVGEDLPTKGPDIFPCPLFHKLTDKNKLKTLSTSGSESKKKGDDSQKSLKVSKSAVSDKKSGGADKSVESEKDSKKSKKKKHDDRFKFNYGYQGIPPQIGHSRCALPCTGTLGAVPKHMGWLWTADNMPGMKDRYGWKPGAISKKLLRLLNKARKHKPTNTEPVKKHKRRFENKSFLVVSKQNGEYRVEMRDESGSNKSCQPLVYSITKADEEEKFYRQNRQGRLEIEDGEKVFPPGASDLVKFKSEFEDSSEDDSSSESSLGADWEIRFTPPIARRK